MPMIVLDCNAAIEILRGTPLGAAISQRLCGEDEVISSDLLSAELASVLRKHVKAGKLSSQLAVRYMRLAELIAQQAHDLEENRVEALAEGLRLNHSTYDMFYFVLARHNAATLITLDRALIQLCRQEGVGCLGPDDFAADNVLFMAPSVDDGGPRPAES